MPACRRCPSTGLLVRHLRKTLLLRAKERQLCGALFWYRMPHTHSQHAKAAAGMVLQFAASERQNHRDSLRHYILVVYGNSNGDAAEIAKHAADIIPWVRKINFTSVNNILGY